MTGKFKKLHDSIEKGNFNIKLIQDKLTKTAKWIVWKRNVKEEWYVSLVSFSESKITNLFHSTKGRIEWMNKLKRDGSKSEFVDSRIFSTDCNRKFTIKEYQMLGNLIKACGYRYNKKKDEFIQIL